MGPDEIKRGEYLALRRVYQPATVRLAIVAESPPASGKYFYNPSGAVTEPLFAAMMRQLRCSPATKEQGLEMFRQGGWVLVDATYQPVNNLSDTGRNKVIADDYPTLRADLNDLMFDRKAPVILIKANVCRLLESKLTEDRFEVLNRRRVVSFPSNGRQNEFHKQFGSILGLIDPPSTI